MFINPYARVKIFSKSALKRARLPSVEVLDKSMHSY
jgi:hypothetical protein